MIDTRPLFDRPTAPVTRKVKTRPAVPTIPPMVKVPAECWRITVVPTGDGPPATIRIRRMLKTAVRAHKLKAVRVERLATIATPDGGTTDYPPDASRVPQIGCNEAGATDFRTGTGNGVGMLVVDEARFLSKSCK